jgi:hypothetical protein
MIMLLRALILGIRQMTLRSSDAGRVLGADFSRFVPCHAWVLLRPDSKGEDCR